MRHEKRPKGCQKEPKIELNQWLTTQTTGNQSSLLPPLFTLLLPGTRAFSLHADGLRPIFSRLFRWLQFFSRHAGTGVIPPRNRDVFRFFRDGRVNNRGTPLNSPRIGQRQSAPRLSIDLAAGLRASSRRHRSSAENLMHFEDQAWARRMA